MTQSNARGKARPSSHTSDGSEVEDVITGRLPPIWAFSVLLVVILAGALFGYDQGVIAGALLGIEKEFSLSAFVLEIVTSWVTLGALFGSLAGGYVADHYGRKPALLVAALLFVVGAAIEAFAPSVPVLVVGRLAVGFGVGVAAVCGAALCRGIGADAAARSFHLILSARHHHRHLPRLYHRRSALWPGRLAAHARHFSHTRSAASARGASGRGVAALVSQDGQA